MTATWIDGNFAQDDRALSLEEFILEPVPHRIVEIKVSQAGDRGEFTRPPLETLTVRVGRCLPALSVDQVRGRGLVPEGGIVNGAAITPDAAEAETLRGASPGRPRRSEAAGSAGRGTYDEHGAVRSVVRAEPSRAAGTDATGTHGFSDDV